MRCFFFFVFPKKTAQIGTFASCRVHKELSREQSGSRGDAEGPLRPSLGAAVTSGLCGTPGGRHGRGSPRLPPAGKRPAAFLGMCVKDSSTKRRLLWQCEPGNLGMEARRGGLGPLLSQTELVQDGALSILKVQNTQTGFKTANPDHPRVYPGLSAFPKTGRSAPGGVCAAARPSLACVCIVPKPLTCTLGSLSGFHNLPPSCLCRP